MKITITIDTLNTDREYRAAGRLTVDGKPLGLTLETAARRDAYVEARWGDQELRTAIAHTVAGLLRDLFKGDGILSWHALRREEADAQAGG